MFGSVHMFCDQYIDKEENIKIIVRFIFNIIVIKYIIFG